jgi:probable rRNA maturation factor
MITVLFQVESHYQVSREKIRTAIETVLAPKMKSDTEVSVSVVGDRQMRQLNRTYRNIDDTTDVLSFPLQESMQQGVAFVDPPDNVLRLGDIVISYPTAVKEAAETDQMVDDVLVMLSLHGLNHLLGIHHPE